jgi:hypothetical protein
MARCPKTVALRQIRFAESHLGRRGYESRCACFDAAMHFKKYGTFFVRENASQTREMRGDREMERHLAELSFQI